MWIDDNSNLADSMTKSKLSAALQRLVDENKLELGTMERVECMNDTNTKLNGNVAAEKKAALVSASECEKIHN
ncbi:hypothetical protein K3495_g1178 [Podosphaera aphanis]|nr:hypothetical protein K3495_g1178 [Podosphaera aphanis]